MKLNNIGYLLKEGFKGIFLHGFMSFAAICVTVACLLIVGSFSILAYNLDIMVEDLNKTSEILVLIDSELSDAEARSIGTKINMLDNVLQSNFVSREEALEDFKEDHNGDSAFDGVIPEDLRHRFVVTLEDNTLMEQTDDSGCGKDQCRLRAGGGLYHHSAGAAHGVLCGDCRAAGSFSADYFQYR